MTQIYPGPDKQDPVTIIGEPDRVFYHIGKVGPTKATVLITGESGTGKELVARAIYYRSKRTGKPFIPINCGALAESLLEAELFGYRKGAYTGALEPRPGIFGEADGGTIFLDEVSEMSHKLQVDLLRVLESGEYRNIGSAKTLKTDVRIIAATNKDLNGLVKNGRFRKDIYHRLNVCPIYLPPLRERPEDIPELTDFFIRKYVSEYKGISGKKIHIYELGGDVEGGSGVVVRVDPELRALLVGHDWPGNVRELKNAIEHAVVYCDDDYILRSEHLHPEVINHLQGPKKPRRRKISRTKLVNALRKTKGNMSEAAGLLGVSRATVYRAVEAYGIVDGDMHTS